MSKIFTTICLTIFQVVKNGLHIAACLDISYVLSGSYLTVEETFDGFEGMAALVEADLVELRSRSGWFVAMPVTGSFAFRSTRRAQRNIKFIRRLLGIKLISR